MIFFCIYFLFALQLAELWPKKLMDNHGIKRAICRAKERRRASNGDLGKEMVSKKLLHCFHDLGNLSECGHSLISSFF